MLSPTIQCGIALMTMYMVAASLQAADSPKKPLRETATVAADANVLKRLGTVEDYLADKRWAEAVDILYEIAQTDGRSLVLVQPGFAGGAAVYLNAATRCNVLLTQLPKAGREAYRRKVDPQAKRWFEAWQRSRDSLELERIVRQAYLSSYGDDALWALGESAWDRTDYSSARLYWSQLVPLPPEAQSTELPTVLHYPDSDLDPAAVLARLVLCTLMEGHLDRALEQQQRFAELYPSAKGALGGRDGTLAELLKQILDESETWNASDDGVEVATFGLAPERTRILPSSIDIGAPRWSRPLTSNLLPQPERVRSGPDRGPLSTHPVVYRDVVLINDADSIFAFNLLTGDPAWPTDQGTGQIYPSVPEERSATPDRTCVGVPWFTMTIAEGKLFARMGSPVTTTSDTELRDLASDIVCLNLADGQGKLVWKVAAHELIREERRPWRFEGSPLVLSGRAYVVLTRRRPQLEFSLACLNASDGKLLWHRTLLSARSVLEDHLNRVSHLLLTAGAGRLFLSTDSGAIVAIDPHDGHMEWALSYESAPSEDIERLSDHARQGLVPAMFHEGLLFVSPNDCEQLYCIEADSGRIRWQRSHPRRERWRHLLGVVSGGNDGRLIVSGNSLWEVDIKTGREKHIVRSSDTIERGYGRGVLAGGSIFWPMREAIQVIDLETNQPLRNAPLSTPDSIETGGNLTISSGMLLVSQPDRLVAYGEYSLLKERLHRNLSLNPDKADLLLKLAEIEASAGNLDAAVKVLRPALTLIESQGGKDASQKQQLSQLRELFRRSARQKLAEGVVPDAVLAFTEAMSLAREPEDRANLLFDLAEVELFRQRPVAAVEYWQKILDDEQLRAAPRHDQTAGSEASASISRLIAQQGRAVYITVEQRAEREIAVRRKAQDLTTLPRVLKQFPQAEVSSRTWLELAGHEREAGNFHAALPIYAKLAESAASPGERATAARLQAETLEAVGYWNESHRVWKRLVTSADSAEANNADGTVRVLAKVARERLASPRYAQREHPEPPRPRYLERSWSQSLSPRDDQSAPASNQREQTTLAKPLVPQGDPPASSLASVLLCWEDDPARATTGRIDCVDRDSGMVRWQQPNSALPIWGAYAETHLLVATESELSARTLEHGHRMWTVALKDESTTDRRPSLQIFFRRPWVVVFDEHSGVRLIDSRTGEIAWSFRPRGRLQPHWSCDAQHIAIQTLQPASTWIIELSSERRAREVSGVPEPWRQPPLLDGTGRAVIVTADRRIECRASLNVPPIWMYRGGMSFAHVDPVLWVADRRLMLTVDGTTLIAVDDENGGARWSAGLCDLPLTDPARQVIASNGMAYVASQGLLRGISLADGVRHWERFLGSGGLQWRTAACGALIAAWPIDAQLAEPRPIVWCDAESGLVVQRLELPAVTNIVDVVGADDGCLVITDNAVSAMTVASETVVINPTRSSDQ